MRVGILKPDHLGDLILSAPAIAALRRRFTDLTLLCHPRNVPLAGHLFPGLRALPMLLPHLDKDRGRDLGEQARHQILREEIDLLICLRWDGQIQRSLTIPDIEYHAPSLADSERHVAAEHRDIVASLTGPYEILDSYTYPSLPATNRRPTNPKAIGLGISAGFRLNAWPLCHWLELAELLHRDHIATVLVGGPAERGRLQILGDALLGSIGYFPQIVIGGNDFGTTLGRLHQLVDLIVATDSGTAHLAALARPVLSLFGGSPWRRFAPLGRFNAILSRRYLCSPCQQFSRASVNMCHTQECLTNLTPRQVHQCLGTYLAGLDLSTERYVGGVWMTEAPWSEKVGASAA
ncbi:MAG TPA: glycosyltransferase family 9 protein [Gemmataceae bacterium]|nr:glycosyltransferase family 9 protein [Gemmataceae bacterium]